MKKGNLLLFFILAIQFSCKAQKDVEIKYSINDEHSLVLNEKEIDGEMIAGYTLADTLFFKNKSNLKLYFFNDKVFNGNKVIYCFENVKNYESLIFANIYGKEYLYIYPNYFGKTGPYIWFGLGILIEIKKNPIIKENFDYFEDTELGLIPKFKKFKTKKGKSVKCADGS